MNTATQERTEPPLVSVIVPVYNTAPWLRKCLDSIINQTYRNLEIICVNDGSPDNAAEILDEYAANDARIRVIHQKNAGVSAARNTGIGLASGEYLSFVDSDDYLVIDAYARLIPHLASLPDILCYGIMGVDESGNEQSCEYMELPCEGVREPEAELIEKTNGYVWNKLFRTAMLREHRLIFPVGIRYEDAMFVYAAAMNAKDMCYVRERLYCYLQRTGSFSQSERAELQAMGFSLMLESLFNYMVQQGLMARWSELFYRLFMYYYERPVNCLPGISRRRAMSEFQRMILRTKMWQMYRNRYPFEELRRYHPMRSLFYWRNATTRVYKFLKWPVLRIEENPQGKRYLWF